MNVKLLKLSIASLNFVVKLLNQVVNLDLKLALWISEVVELIPKLENFSPLRT